MFAVLLAAVLGLASVSRAAPLPCETLVRPLEQLDVHSLEGRWALVAGGLKDPRSQSVLTGRDSVAIDFKNSSYTQANRYDALCQYISHDILVDGNVLRANVRTYNFTGTLFHTSCPDCVVLKWDVASPSYETSDLYLFSRRREVTEAEMEEFVSQVKCLNMPPRVVMDPTKELCPEQTSTEGQTA